MYCGLKHLSYSRMNRCAYGAAAVLMFLALALWTGCGDVFRPTANPIPGPTVDPRNFHIAVVISQNAVGNPGSGMQIDVSGDSNVGVIHAGQQPVYAALLPTGNRVFVSNSDGTVTSFTPAGFLGAIGAPSTISLPAGLLPGFLFTAENGTMYVATTGANPTCTTAPNTGVVLAINTGSLAVENIICVDPNPTVLTETPDGRKLYSVNGDGTVSSINVVDKTVNPPISCQACTPSLTNPVWAVASVDSSEVFVLDGTGFIWTINTLTDQVSTPLGTASPSNYIALDRVHNRLYVTGPATASTPPTLRILDASSPSLSSLTAAPLPLPAGTTPVMAAFLPNGTRAYILGFTATNTPVVTVINTSNNTVFSTINLPAATANPNATAACQAVRFPFSMAASGNSTRLYVANCYAASTSIIDTSTNALVLTMNSPTSAYTPVGGATFPPPENPVFVVAGP
jgi:hypothetical protein